MLYTTTAYTSVENVTANIRLYLEGLDARSLVTVASVCDYSLELMPVRKTFEIEDVTESYTDWIFLSNDEVLGSWDQLMQHDEILDELADILTDNRNDYGSSDLAECFRAAGYIPQLGAAARKQLESKGLI